MRTYEPQFELVLHYAQWREYDGPCQIADASSVRTQGHPRLMRWITVPIENSNVAYATEQDIIDEIVHNVRVVDSKLNNFCKILICIFKVEYFLYILTTYYTF